MEHLESLGITVGKGKHYEEIIYSVVLIYNLLHNEISDYLKQFDLSPAKLNVMMIIKHQGGEQGISQVELSKKLIVTPSNMTRLLDRLEREKLVRRLSLESDRRVKLIKVTERGSQLLDNVWPGYVTKLKALASSINVGDQKNGAEVMMRWTQKLLNG